MAEGGDRHTKRNIFVRFLNEIVEFTSGTSSNTEELGGRLLALVRWSPRCELGSEKLATIRKLVRKGAQVNCTTRDEHYSPLHFACTNGDHLAADALIKLGADVNMRSLQCSTPLHLAANRGRSDICELLLSSGAEVNAQNAFSETPLHVAATQPCAETIQLLLDHGADSSINANKVSFSSPVTKLPQTPFTFAIQCGLLDSILVFLRNGDSLKDFDAQTFLCRAHTYRMKQTAVKCFTEAGIKMSPVTLSSSSWKEKFNKWPDELITLLSQPRSLHSLCVQQVRHSIGHRSCFLKKVTSLPIPRTLQKRILYLDLDEIRQEERTGNEKKWPVSIYNYSCPCSSLIRLSALTHSDGSTV